MWLYPPLQLSWKGGILVSPCPSVRLWTESCPLCIFNNTHRIHFIFAHLIKQLKKVCRVSVMPVSKFKYLKFWRIFYICNFDFVFFWLGIQYDSMVWVIMRRWWYPQNAGVLVVLIMTTYPCLNLSDGLNHPCFIKRHQQPVSIYICCLTSIEIPIIKIKWSHDHLIFMIEIPYLGRQSLYWNRA